MKEKLKIAKGEIMPETMNTERTEEEEQPYTDPYEQVLTMIDSDFEKGLVEMKNLVKMYQ